MQSNTIGFSFPFLKILLPPPASSHYPLARLAGFKFYPNRHAENSQILSEWLGVLVNNTPGSCYIFCKYYYQNSSNTFIILIAEVTSGSCIGNYNLKFWKLNLSYPILSSWQISWRILSKWTDRSFDPPLWMLRAYLDFTYDDDDDVGSRLS